MFKRIDCETSIPGIRQAFHKLVRKIQTDIEHKRVFNGNGSDMVKGHVCISTGDNIVSLAANTSEANASWVGVMAEPTVDGALGVMRTQGFGLVKFVTTDDLEDQEGSVVFVSDRPGQATITEPGLGDFNSRLGILADATEWNATTNPYAWVWIGHCCAVVGRQ